MSDAPALPPLSVEQLRAINYIEQIWHRDQVIPGQHQLSSKIKGFSLKDNLNHPTFRLSLVNRGVELPPSVDFSPKGEKNEDATYLSKLMEDDEISVEQAAAIITVTNFEDRRTRRVKLAELGISLAQWNGWLKSKKFKNYLHQLSFSNFQESAYVAHEGLLKAVDKGDTNAIKYYMEMTGRFTSASEGGQNIRVVLARLTEVLQRYVSPETLVLIGQDFQAVMRGEILAEPPKALEGSI